jgi:hypothetical protein
VWPVCLQAYPTAPQTLEPVLYLRDISVLGLCYEVYWVGIYVRGLHVLAVPLDGCGGCEVGGGRKGKNHCNVEAHGDSPKCIDRDGIGIRVDKEK